MQRRIDVSALGTAIRLEFDEGLTPGEVDALAAPWRDCGGTPPNGLPARTIHVRMGDPSPGSPDGSSEVVSARSLCALGSTLSTRVTLAAIASRAGDLVMLHAGAVAAADGSVVAFVAPSGMGKTSLVRVLGSEYGYVTDETVGIDAEGRVFPYRKPLSVLAEIRRGEAKRQLPPSALGLLRLPDAPLRIRQIVVLHRDSEAADTPVLEPMPLADAFAQVAPQLSHLRELPRPLCRLAGLFDSVGGVVSLQYREADSVLPLMPELLSGGGRREPWRPAFGGMGAGLAEECSCGAASTVVAPPSGLSGVGSAVRRLCGSEGARSGEFVVGSGVLDAIETRRGVIVLVASELHLLSGIAPVIWREARCGASFDSLLGAVIAEYGAPPDGEVEPVLRRVLAQMMGSGVIAHAPSSQIYGAR